MDEMGLNERQRKAVDFVKANGRISNIEYQQLTGANKKMASRDLDGLVDVGALSRVGTTGRGTYYIISGKGT